MPSTTSSSVSSDLASSTVITPSLPTFSIALAIMAPMSTSPLEEMVPTCAISCEVSTLRERPLMSLTTAATAMSMPRFRSIGFMPAAMALMPSRTIAWVSTVAVVVPSPAMSEVFEATSRTIWAPMFSNLSASSISLATVTPSLEMRGAPNDLSRTTLRPLGPSVTLTASARMSTPRSMRARASVENFTSLAVMCRCLPERLRGFPGLGSLVDHAQDVRLLEDQQILAVDLDLGPAPLGEQDAVSDGYVQRHHLAALVARAGAGGEHLALLRLVLGGVGNDDASRGLIVGLDPTDQHAVVQRTEAHRCFLLVVR